MIVAISAVSGAWAVTKRAEKRREAELTDLRTTLQDGVKALQDTLGSTMESLSATRERLAAVEAVLGVMANGSGGGPPQIRGPH